MTRASMSVRAEPNVTPMIDVMLVLLIIFMVVGPTLMEGFRAVPPSARYADRHPDEPGEVVVGMDAQGRLYLNKVAIDSVTLRQRLETRFREHPADRVVFLRADESLPFEELQNTMALASSAGAQVVGLVSRSPAPRK